MIPQYRISIHPGEVLLEEFLKPSGISQSELARKIGVKSGVINGICKQRRAVSPRMALLLAKAFKVSPDLTRAMQDEDCAEAAELAQAVL